MPGQNSTQQSSRSRQDSVVSIASGSQAKYEPQKPTHSQVKTVSKLTALPNEILLKIAHYLRVDLPPMEKEERFDGRERHTFVRAAADLHNLSQTSRVLRPVAQEALLHTIVLGGFDGLPAIESLVRLLLHYPEAGRLVKRLRLGLPPNERFYLKNDEDAKNMNWSTQLYGPPPSDIQSKAAEVIAQAPFKATIRERWQASLSSSYSRPLCGVLLTLTPHLEYLSLSHSLGVSAGNRIMKKMFGVSTSDDETDFSVLPGLASLHYFNNKTSPKIRPSLQSK